MRPDSYQKLAQ